MHILLPWVTYSIVHNLPFIDISVLDFMNDYKMAEVPL